ncbi:MAG: hypothetical protein HC848_10150 [Limnobacter sp.]|nr:hypothetical protein [Limnobacter sp.]
MLVGQAARAFELWTGRTPDAQATLAHLRMLSQPPGGSSGKKA